MLICKRSQLIEQMEFDFKSLNGCENRLRVGCKSCNALRGPLCYTEWHVWLCCGQIALKFVVSISTIRRAVWHIRENYAPESVISSHAASMPSSLLVVFVLYLLRSRWSKLTNELARIIGNYCMLHRVRDKSALVSHHMMKLLHAGCMTVLQLVSSMVSNLMGVSALLCCQSPFHCQYSCCR